MHVPVKWTAVAQVEKARLVATAQRMRRFGWQTDECLAGEILLAAIVGDVGEGSLEPDVSLVTAVTVIGDREVRRNPQQHSGLATIKSGARCAAKFQRRLSLLGVKTRSRPFPAYVGFYHNRTQSRPNFFAVLSLRIDLNATRMSFAFGEKLTASGISIVD